MSHQIDLALNSPRFIKGGLRLAPQRCEPTTAFRWPLDPLGELAPRVLAARDGERPSVDLGYMSKQTKLVPVLAANDAEVSFAFGRDGHYAVSLDHGGTWCTHYAGLDKLAVIATLPRRQRRQRVRTGDVIGYTTAKLGFELWRWTDDRGFVAVDPRPHLASWVDAPAGTDAIAKKAA